MDAPTPGLRPPRRFSNNTKSAVKTDLVVETGEEVEVTSEAAAEHLARTDLTETTESKPAKKKKAPAKKKAAPK